MVISVFMGLWLGAPLSGLSDTTLILPGGGSVNGRLVKPYRARTITYRLVDGREEQIGTVEDQYSWITIDGIERGLRVARIVLPGREILDSGLVDASSLKPFYHHSHQRDRTMLLTFGERAVTGTTWTAAKTDTVAIGLPYAIFDSYFEDFIARSITLKDGLQFSFPDFILEAGGLVYQSGKVRRLATEGPAGRWTVSYTDSKTGRETTYTLDDQRRILDRVYRINGKTTMSRPEFGRS